MLSKEEFVFDVENYGIEDGVLLASTKVIINDKEFNDKIPYFLDRGFLLENIINTVDVAINKEQEQIIADKLAKLNDEIKEWLTKKTTELTIIYTDVRDDFTYFYLKFDGKEYNCRKEENSKVFEVYQTENSDKNQTEMWEECNFLSVDDLQFNFVKQHVHDCEVMTDELWTSPLFVINFKKGDDKCHFEEWINGDRDDGYFLERTDSSYYNSNLYDKLFNDFQALITEDEFFKVCEKIFVESCFLFEQSEMENNKEF